MEINYRLGYRTYMLPRLTYKRSSYFDILFKLRWNINYFGPIKLKFKSCLDCFNWWRKASSSGHRISNSCPLPYWCWAILISLNIFLRVIWKVIVSNITNFRKIQPFSAHICTQQYSSIHITELELCGCSFFCFILAFHECLREVNKCTSATHLVFQHETQYEKKTMFLILRKVESRMNLFRVETNYLCSRISTVVFVLSSIPPT